MQALGLGALAALADDDHLRAETLSKETLTISRRLGMGHFTAAGLVNLGACAALQERPIRSAVLWGAAESLFEAMGAARMPAEFAFNEPYVDAARAQVDEGVWESALARGRAMSEEEALGYALSERELPPASRLSDASPAVVGGSPLTHREGEIAALVARGLTNRQVSAELSVSEHTVANHLAKIRRKLGLGSRAQVAAWAAQRQTTS
jgi:non-specific serine/threonine protein kinase